MSDDLQGLGTGKVYLMLCRLWTTISRHIGEHRGLLNCVRLLLRRCCLCGVLKRGGLMKVRYKWELFHWTIMV